MCSTANPHLVLPCRREGNALPFDVELQLAHGALRNERVWSTECAGGTGEVPSGDCRSDGRTANWSSVRACLRYRMHLDAARGPPGADSIKTPLSTAPQGALR